MFEMQFFGLDTGPQSFCCLFIALSIIRSKSAQKLAVQVCQIATVVTETMQPIKKILSHQYSFKCVFILCFYFFLVFFHFFIVYLVYDFIINIYNRELNRVSLYQK